MTRIRSFLDNFSFVRHIMIAIINLTFLSNLYFKQIINNNSQKKFSIILNMIYPASLICLFLDFLLRITAHSSSDRIVLASVGFFSSLLFQTSSRPSTYQLSDQKLGNLLLSALIIKLIKTKTFLISPN